MTVDHPKGIRPAVLSVADIEESSGVEGGGDGGKGETDESLARADRNLGTSVTVSVYVAHQKNHSLSAAKADSQTSRASSLADAFEQHSPFSQSTIFHPEHIVDGLTPDIIIVSSDGVLFSVHRARLISASAGPLNDAFRPTTAEIANGTPSPVTLHAEAVVISVVLHAIYGHPSDVFNSALETLLDAIRVMKTYGISLDRIVGPSTTLFEHIMSKIEQNPLEVFLVATENNMEDLAVASSSHVLSFPMTSVTEEMASRMGVIYLKRLATLHMRRMKRANRVLEAAPKVHPFTPTCGVLQRDALEKAWMLAAANIILRLQAGELASSSVRAKVTD